MALPLTLEAIYYLFKGTADQGIPTSGYDFVTEFPSIDPTETVLVPPDAKTLRTNTVCWAFDSSSEEGVFGTISLPGSYSPGSDVVLGVSWLKETLNVGNVDWSISYCTSNPHRGSNLTEAVNNRVVAAAPGVAFDTVATTLATINGTNLTAGEVISYRLSRVGNSGNDTFPNTVALLNVYLSFEVDRVSARNRTHPFYT